MIFFGVYVNMNAIMSEIVKISQTSTIFSQNRSSERCYVLNLKPQTKS